MNHVKPCICVRLEDKNEWESRTPLVPAHVGELKEKHGVHVAVQSSPIRAFDRAEYEQAGATVAKGLPDCRVVFAVKEIPQELFERGKTYVFFSHTIKGQKANMPMLQRLLDLGCQLIDYEKIVDESGRRMVFFGNYAGLAGMLDTLWGLGQRLTWEKIETPFSQIRQARTYNSLDEAIEAVRGVGQRIASEGLCPSLAPLICGFAGYGNVSGGAQEIFDLLPVQEIAPDDLLTFDEHDPHKVYKVVFKEQDMVELAEPIAQESAFDLQDYYDNPRKYRSKFERYVPHLTILVNGIYWTERYPRLITRQYLKELFKQGPNPRLRIIGDISCDEEGAIECNLRATTPGSPIYVYDPLTGQTHDGHAGKGVVVLAVDNLPCELPRESSTHFSETLVPFVPEIAKADYDAPFDQGNLSPTLKRAVIAWKGKLTPDHSYLQKFL